MTPNADYVGHSRSSEAGPPRAGEAVEAERRQDQAEPRNTAPPTINADSGGRYEPVAEPRCVTGGGTCLAATHCLRKCRLGALPTCEYCNGSGKVGPKGLKYDCPDCCATGHEGGCRLRYETLPLQEWADSLNRQWPLPGVPPNDSLGAGE